MARLRRFATGKPAKVSTRGPKTGGGIKTYAVIQQLYQGPRTAHQIFVMTDIPVDQVSRILYRFVQSGVAQKQKLKGKGDGRRAPIYRIFFDARRYPDQPKELSKPRKYKEIPAALELDHAFQAMVRVPK